MTYDNEPSGAEKRFGDFAPAPVGFTVLFGQVWTRPQLSPKERSLSFTTSVRPRRTAHRGGTHRGHHPPGLLRRLAQGHVRHDRRQAGLHHPLTPTHPQHPKIRRT